MSILILADDLYYVKLLSDNKSINNVYLVMGNFNDHRKHEQIMKSISNAISLVVKHYDIDMETICSQFYVHIIDPSYYESSIYKIEDITSYSENFNDMLKASIAGDLAKNDNRICFQI